tara:strand:- start:28 stop:303 length:276 start_codon:yes stop_codon:yes gene_type:complete
MKQKTNKIQKNERLYASIDYNELEFAKRSADHLAKKLILNDIRYKLKVIEFNSNTVTDFNDPFIVLKVDKQMKQFNSMTLEQLELIEQLIK